jgi:hypothetical protein
MRETLFGDEGTGVLLTVESFILELFVRDRFMANFQYNAPNLDPE